MAKMNGGSWYETCGEGEREGEMKIICYLFTS